MSLPNEPGQTLDRRIPYDASYTGWIVGVVGSLQIVGRDAELARVCGFLDATQEGSRVLALVGEPGIGKTALWAAGVAEARSRGY